MTLRKLLMTLQKLLFLLFVGWLIVAPVPEKAFHSNSIGVETAFTGRGGGRQNSESFREMLKKHFPDFNERINYQKKQAKFYRSALNKISEAKRVGMSNSLKLTSQEQDALDYYNGKNFYSSYQNVKTSPLILGKVFC